MSRQSDAVEKAIAAEIAKAAKTLVLQIDRNLRKATPVLTGHARASWVPSVGSPSTDEPDAADNALHDAGVLQVLSYRTPDQPLYEATNVPYMPLLIAGRSNQAPPGWFEVAIAQAEDAINAKYAGRVVLDVTSGYGAAGAENLADAYSPFGGDE